jgi:hypothetical protein
MVQDCGKNAIPKFVKLGPFAVDEKTLPQYLADLSSMLNRVGCTYKDALIEPDFYATDSIKRGLGAFFADYPVAVILNPKMENPKWEYHYTSELMGWPLADLDLNCGKALVDVKGLSGIEVIITGMAGKRFRTAEAAVRMASAGYR